MQISDCRPDGYGGPNADQGGWNRGEGGGILHLVPMRVRAASGGAVDRTNTGKAKGDCTDEAVSALSVRCHRVGTGALPGVGSSLFGDISKAPAWCKRSPQ